MTTMFMAPVPHFARNDAELERLKRDLREAQRIASEAGSWTSRVRAEQAAKQLSQEIAVAEALRKAAPSTSLQHREHDGITANAIAEGRIAPPIPYWLERAPEARRASELRASANAAPETIAENSTAPVSFAQLTRLINEARAKGMFRSR